jgi:hypothetical protein
MPMTWEERQWKMQRLVLKGVIDEVIGPFCQLYETLHGLQEPLHVGEYEVIIRRRREHHRPFLRFR